MQMNLEDQMTVARDADRMSKKKLKNAKARAKRAAKKAAIAMNAEIAVSPQISETAEFDPMLAPAEQAYVAPRKAQGAEFPLLGTTQFPRLKTT